MRLVTFAILYLFATGFAHAGNTGALSLLKRDLGQSIEVISKREIRYCPDNTCDIIKAKKATNLLPEFLYLYLFHESDYPELGKSFNDKKPFRDTAAEEPEIRMKVAAFCPNQQKSVQCILDSMCSSLGIQVCIGRYDEGEFCVSCGDRTSCKKL